MSELKKISYTVPISKELFEMLTRPSTLADIARRDHDLEKFRAKREAAQPAFRAAIAAIDHVEEPYAAVVLKLHARSGSYTGHQSCEGCDYAGFDGEPPEWPCSTVELLAEELQIDWPTDWHLCDWTTIA